MGEAQLAEDSGVIEDAKLTDEQKRRLRAVRRGYRASNVEIKNNGWEIEITYLDGSTVSIDSKLLKLKKHLLHGG